MLITYYIYTLTNPDNNEVFYVGCTTDTKKRLASHCSINESEKNAKSAYVKGMTSAPQLSVLTKIVGDQKTANALEAEWIQKMLAKGCPLTNTRHTIPEHLRVKKDYTSSDRKRKSESLSNIEYTQLKRFSKTFRTGVDCAQALGVDRNVMDRVLLCGSGSPKTIEQIRTILSPTLLKIA